MSLRIAAHSKLNLWLRVIGDRADGYHALDSLVQTIDLSDELIFTLASNGIRVDCDPPILDENIVRAAAELALAATGCSEGLHITLRKRVPIGSGMGGGSSDAAATILGVSKLLGERLPHEDMAQIAAQLGSDVPLFLKGGRIRMQGRGELLQSEPFRSESYVVLAPPIRSDTAAVYAAFDRLPNAARELASAPELGANDLAHAAQSIYPDLVKYERTIGRCGGVYAGMTGSGSAFFAAFEDEVTAARAAERLKRRHPESRVYTCRSTAQGFEELGRSA